ncbi:hypothetical protein B0H14DRAFT_2381202, partial [Mycena olivaceomarginata]
FLVAWYLVWQDSGFPAVNFAWNNAGSFNQHVNVQSNHATPIRQIDAASTVLLKNTNSVLPLKAPKTIALIGNGAANSFRGANGVRRWHSEALRFSLFLPKVFGSWRR